MDGMEWKIVEMEEEEEEVQGKKGIPSWRSLGTGKTDPPNGPTKRTPGFKENPQQLLQPSFHCRFLLLQYFLSSSSFFWPCPTPSRNWQTSPRNSSGMERSSSVDAQSVCPIPLHFYYTKTHSRILTRWKPADKREFIKISQAVGMGFLIMVCTRMGSALQWIGWMVTVLSHRVQLAISSN